MNVFKLIRALRPINLLMTVFILISVRYGILKYEAINATWFPFYVIALIFLMCFGYLINDFFDVETDRINKPGKNIFDSSQTLQPMAFMCVSAGIGIIIPITGFLRNYHWANLLLIYLFSGFTLFLYAKYFKNTAFLGNLVIAVLSALAIIVPANIKAQGIYISAHSILLISIYSLFALLTTLVREIIKDAEDEEGDKAAGIRTIATLAGNRTSVYFSSVLMIICILLLIGTGYYFFDVKNILPQAIAFFILAVCGLFPFFKIIRASEKKHFSSASAFIKIWMLLGIISMWI